MRCVSVNCYFILCSSFVWVPTRHNNMDCLILEKVKTAIMTLTGPKNFKSTLGFKYPSTRDVPLKTGLSWLDGKRLDDGAEGFWRIHDELYDLTRFAEAHPGGPSWITRTKGTDITEAFETHHLKGHAEKLLEKYHERHATAPRNSPFTFHADGFYKTLKTEIAEELKKAPQAPVRRSKMIADFLVFAYVTLALGAVYHKSYVLGVLSGIFLGLNAICAHNFFHQKDNFRMYYFDLTLMQSKGWRITHALSHHLYTNTVNDVEISFVEPFLQLLPWKKNVLIRYLSWAYSPVLWTLVFFGEFIRNVIDTIVRKERNYSLLLPFTVLVLMLGASTGPSTILMFFWIQMVASFHFGAVGLNAAHHHPDIFHDGDAARPKEEMDWGIHQLDAVMDRKDITGSHFLVLTNFGDHALHHLFPTVDHGILEHLYPVFLRVCKEFGVDWKLVSQIDLVKGQFQQLARVEPNKKPPKALKKTTKNYQ